MDNPMANLKGSSQAGVHVLTGARLLDALRMAPYLAPRVTAEKESIAEPIEIP